MLPTSAIALLAGLFAVALAIGFALSFVFAEITGWRRLARRFRGGSRAQGVRVDASGILLGAWGWNAPPLHVAIDDDALSLTPLIPFRFAFPPVRIPWSAVAAVEYRRYVVFEVTQLRYDTTDGATLGFLPSAAARAIARRIEPR